MMQDLEWLWILLFFVGVAVAGVLFYLYLDYKSGRNRQQLPPRGSRQVYHQPPSPSVTLPQPESKAMPQPRVVFGATYDLIPGQQQSSAAGPQPAQINRECPVCRRSISSSDYQSDRIIICPNCRTHVHVDCWEYSGNKCPNCGQ